MGVAAHCSRKGGGTAALLGGARRQRDSGLGLDSGGRLRTPVKERKRRRVLSPVEMATGVESSAPASPAQEEVGGGQTGAAPKERKRRNSRDGAHRNAW
jgi:hypothetical protein